MEFDTLNIICIAITAAAVLGLLIFLRSRWLLRRAINSGLDLLSENDYASRLVTSTHPDVRALVSLYNRLADNLKNERLRTLEQDRLLNLLIEASPMGVAMCDLNGHIVNSNRAFKNMTSSTLVERLYKLAEGQTTQLTMPDGSVYRLSNLWYMDRGFRRPFFIVEALTDTIRQAERRAYEQAIRTMAHEVNNSLGAFGSVFQTLEETIASDQEAETIRACMARCESLSGFVKAYSQVAKPPQPRFEAIDMAVFLREQLPFLQALAGPGIVVELNATPVTLNIDLGLISQVLVNLVKNAAESLAFTQGSKKIDIALHGRSLTVTDNGAGLSSEASSRLFSPFFSTKPGGQGLGLMMVTAILNSHNARYSLATAGGLTTFTITF